MELVLTKMHGLGNDFILVDDRDGRVAGRYPYPDLARKLCDRHFSIGGDGLIVVLPSQSCDMAFAIFNSDGSEAGMCGNGMRCFARFLYEKGLLRQKVITVETLSGPVVCILENDEEDRVMGVRVDMGPPRLLPADIPFVWDGGKEPLEVALKVLDQTFQVTPVSMGNPHAVIFMEDIDPVPLEIWGPAVENHPSFPEKTNVEFVQVLSPESIRVRVWERGAGVTLACGTGACAALVASVLTGRTGKKVEVLLPGGRLLVEWDDRSGHLYKSGPAETIFETSIRI
ncbi:diaminopimelate epimerase [Desulfobotulus sp. H1]|uniref:Diaminopimelate epimerase n=1 Tax=Desulfobotulus pelophilus TaxID=2823377 RepID=A0ABT3N915_9BACT|nr:diaminopimelate epimerase [Desulfobotulus pelophilus]MCW7753957.1 diaminopimelate epimerase [Desulfobotulus pelophilus]